MKKNEQHFGTPLEAIMYPFLLLLLMWTVYWGEQVSGYDLVQYGVLPQHLSGWKGVLFMPLLHAPNDIAHIVNNSIPTAVLTAALFFYYREVAWKVLGLSWLVTGLGVWIMAKDDGAYHIGMSGVIYALFGFLFVSGFFRKYRPLQVVSLGVVLLYGSMIWGIFPQKANISWEGHLSGLGIGVILAIVYRYTGPTGPKYQYEIEKELGIEPPDLEGMWIARQEEMQRRQEEALQRQREALEQLQNQAVHIVYHVRPSAPQPQQQPPQATEGTPPDDSAAK